MPLMQIRNEGIHIYITKYMEIWESNCLEIEAYCGKMEHSVTYLKYVAKKLDSPFPPTPHKLQVDF